MPTDYMYVTKSIEDWHFEQGQLNRYENIQLSPSAGVLNYGQVILQSALPTIIEVFFKSILQNCVTKFIQTGAV